MLCRADISIILGVFLLALAPSAGAQSATLCPPGQVPHYVFGFAALKAQLGAIMGDPLSCEFPDPNGTGDVHQRTSNGLAFWRKRTNTPTYTDGYHHWALVPGGLAYWTGTSIDPPADATVISRELCDSLPGSATGPVAAACFVLWASDRITSLSAPAAPPAPQPLLRPSDEDLEVRLQSVDTLLGEHFPSVRVRVCNRAIGWKATEIVIRYAFYDSLRFPTLDSATHRINDDVAPGECRSFSKSLSALQPWSFIGIDRVTWTWVRL